MNKQRITNLLALTLLAFTLPAQAQDATITMAIDRPGWTISKYLIGMDTVYGNELDVLWENPIVADWMHLEEYISYCREIGDEPMVGINIRPGKQYDRRDESPESPASKIYTYKEVDGVKRELEIHFPENHKSTKEPVPAIILFHGGGWGGGERKALRPQCKYFANRAIVAPTVTYRLVTKEDRAAMKGKGSAKSLCIPDVKSAIRWYKQHADEFGIDPQRIIVGGGSAGGHISLIGTNNPGLNDPQDPEGFDTSAVAYVLFNPALSIYDARDKETDFIQHLSANTAPAIAFFGDQDKWLKGWKPTYEKWKSLEGTSVEVHIAKGEGHSFFTKQPWRDLTLLAADEFLQKQGLLKGEPTLTAPEGKKLEFQTD